MTTQLEPLMPCEHVVQLLWEYLDGEIDEERRGRIEEHLALCDHCRDHFEFEGAFLRSVATLRDEPPEIAALRARIVRALRGEGH